VAEFYRVVRVRPNGSEQIIRDIPWASVSEEQLLRAEAFTDGTARALNGQHIRLYSSQEDGSVSPDDLIWDSEIDL